MANKKTKKCASCLTQGRAFLLFEAIHKTVDLQKVRILFRVNKKKCYK